MDSVKSNGWSTSYYQIPDTAEELQDLIEHKNMNFAVANIFKAAYRLGDKEGTDPSYDLRKIMWFAQRELDRLDLDSKPEALVAALRAHSERVIQNVSEFERQRVQSVDDPGDSQPKQIKTQFAWAEPPQPLAIDDPYPSNTEPYPGGYDD